MTINPSNSQSQNDETKQPSRRYFIIGAAAACGVAATWAMRRPTIASVAASGITSTPGNVTVVQFSDAGTPTGKVTIPRVIKSDAEWKKQLSPNAYDITRRADTEMAYSGSTWNLHDHGLYRCICCENALFSSETKFESGTGWPSFWQPVAKENIIEISDSTLGMERTAVSCRECDAHLGHVFDDGPRPTGLRYCMNSAAMHFVKTA